MLRRLLDVKKISRFIEAHSPISALISENAIIKDKGKNLTFDGFWSSSLTDSTSMGKPDNEYVDNSLRLNVINNIFDVTSKPLIFDGDTGGKKEHFEMKIKSIERLGISAIIIEDKTGLKKNSLHLNTSNQTQENADLFAEKISIGKKAQGSEDFMIIARIESFILNKGLDDAMRRAKKYVDAGADGIMIHSKSKKPNEVLLADLYFDPKELFEMSYSELKGQIGKSGAFKKIAINKTQPIVNVNLIDNPDKVLDLSLEVLADRAQMINENQEFKQKLSQILEDDDKTWPEKNIVEQKIYDGFSSNADKLWMERFEISNWDEKVKLIDGFEDERYRELASRIVCYEKPEFASDEMLENYNNLVRSRLFTKGPWNTPGETLDQATLKVETAIRETEDSEKKEIYEQLLNHYKTKTDQFSQS